MRPVSGMSQLGDQDMVALYSLAQPQFLPLCNGDLAPGRSSVCVLWGVHTVEGCPQQES